MSVLASHGVLLCIILLVSFGISILPAIRHDAHLAHRPGTCPDGECDQP
jgi:hypothetical protein